MRPVFLALLLSTLAPHAQAGDGAPAPAVPGLDIAPAPSGTAAPKEFAAPRPGLHAGGQPTAQDLARLRAQGVHTVIDLRGPGEDHGFDEAAEAARLGMQYVALPIAGKDDITPANADALAALLERYGDGVLLHCASGNRVGALLALGAARAGMPGSEALALGRQVGLTSLEPVVAEQLAPAIAPRASD
jgi:uncharacterized protein (TIGR01244 family)